MDVPALDMHVTYGVVQGNMYEIMDYERYSKIKDVCSDSTAISVNHKGEDIVLPLRGKHNVDSSVPGVYNSGPIDFFIYPKDEDINEYKPTGVMDITNTNSMADILEKQNSINKMQEPWMLTPDAITAFPICQDDQPEMKGLKMAYNSKNMDFDKYASRFGSNFPNDKRQLKGHSITLKILKRMCENCDIDVSLVFTNKNPNVPNPMSSPVTISLTDEFGYNETEDKEE